MERPWLYLSASFLLGFAYAVGAFVGQDRASDEVAAVRVEMAAAHAELRAELTALMVVMERIATAGEAHGSQLVHDGAALRDVTNDELSRIRSRLDRVERAVDIRAGSARD